MVAAIGFVNYSYKFLVAVCMTPIIYLLHAFIDRFLGSETSEELRREAAKS